MWSFDGVKFSEGAEPIRFALNERVRVKLVNDSMMSHPIHLHGHFFELVNGHPGRHPLKHTVNVLPGGIVSFDLTADAPLSILPPNAAPIERVPPVANFNFLPDMGRMTA